VQITNCCLRLFKPFRLLQYSNFPVLTASLPELDNHILQIQNKLCTSSQADPWYSTYLAILAEARLGRYDLSDENDDLGRSFAHSTEAILLPFYPPSRHDPHVITIFFFLADALLRLSQKFNQLGNIKHCVNYFRYLRYRSLEASCVTRGHITTVFAWAVAIQVQMESVDPTGGIGEMSALCRELLPLDVSEELLISSMKALLRLLMTNPSQ